MANIEYEYSFKVDSVKPYIEYCEKNGYKLTSKTYQNRVVYENKHSDKIIARVTKTKSNDVEKEVFDCKNVGEEHKNLKISNESIPMAITDNNRDAINSVLEVLDFYVAANNVRNRYVYEKESVKFEIDDYIEPKAQVVAIEGEKSAVDKVYKEIQKIK